MPARPRRVMPCHAAVQGCAPCVPPPSTAPATSASPTSPTPTITAPTDADRQGHRRLHLRLGPVAATAARTTSTPGATIGHECVGVVEEVGSEVTVVQARRLRRSCRSTTATTPAPHCRAGMQAACENLGFTVSGQAEYARVTQAEGSLVKTDGMPDAVADPVAADALRRDGHRLARGGRRPACSPGGTAVVVGDGAVGLCGVLAAPVMGAERSSRCRATSRARRSPASSAPPTSSPSAARRAPSAVKELTDGSRRRRRPRVRRHRRRDAARRSRSPARAPRSASSACRTASSCRCAGCSSKNVGLAGGMAPVRALPARAARAGRSTARIDPGLVFDRTLPLDEVAEGYRAMDEREAIKVLHRAGSLRTSPMTSWCSGPLVRYVDDTSATIWVETAGPPGSRCASGSGASRRATFGAHGHHYALVELTGLEPGTHARRTRVEVDDERVWPPAGSEFPPVGDRHAGARQAAADGVRLLPGQRAARRRTATTRSASTRCAAYALSMAGLTDARPATRTSAGPTWCCSSATRCTPTRPATRCGVHRVPPRHRRAARRGAQGLRGVRPPLPAGLGRPGEPVAALDAAQRDDLRRPRHPRRLEHQLELEAGDGGRPPGGTTGSSAASRRTGSTSTSATSGRTSAPTTSSGSGSSAHDGPDELDVTAELDALADRADQQPESYRWSYVRDFDTQARLVVVDSRAARVLDPDHRSMLDDDEMAWLDEQMQGGFDHLLDRHLAAVPAGPRAAPRRGVQRGARRGRLGQARRQGRRAAAAGGRPGALGGVPAGLPRRGRDGARGRRGGARPGAADDHVPLRRRAPQLRRRGAAERRAAPQVSSRDRAGRLLADPQPAAAVHARRHVRGGAQAGRPVRAGAVPARQGAARRRWSGGSATGPGTTTTWPSSSCATAGCGCGGRRARSSTGRTGRCCGGSPRSTRSAEARGSPGSP